MKLRKEKTGKFPSCYRTVREFKSKATGNTMIEIQEYWQSPSRPGKWHYAGSRVVNKEAFYTYTEQTTVYDLNFNTILRAVKGLQSQL